MVRRMLTMLVGAALLAGCGGPDLPVRSFTATPGATPTPIPPDLALGCLGAVAVAEHPNLPVVAPTAIETRARRDCNPNADPRRGKLGALFDARYVTIVSSARDGEAGQRAWPLIFDWSPAPPQPREFPLAGFDNRYSLPAAPADATLIRGCTGAVPLPATPAPCVIRTTGPCGAVAPATRRGADALDSARDGAHAGEYARSEPLPVAPPPCPGGGSCRRSP